ncbi:hypothetical protein Tco_0120640 [Tanacetum coccineum]
MLDTPYWARPIRRIGIRRIGNYEYAFSCEDLALIRCISFLGYDVLPQFIESNKEVRSLYDGASVFRVLLEQGLNISGIGGNNSGQQRIVKCFNCQREDPGVAEGPVTQTIITHNATYQADDLDAYDSDCDNFSIAKAVLMANLSSYGSDVLSEVPHFENTHNDMLNQSPFSLVAEVPSDQLLRSLEDWEVSSLQCMQRYRN